MCLQTHTHTHTHTHARTHSRTHTHTRTHARTHARTHTALPKTHLFRQYARTLLQKTLLSHYPKKPTPSLPTRNRLQTTWHKHLNLEREDQTTGAPRAGQCQARQQYTCSHARGPSVSLSIGSGCLDVANAELSPKR